MYCSLGVLCIGILKIIYNTANKLIKLYNMHFLTNPFIYIYNVSLEYYFN